MTGTERTHTAETEADCSCGNPSMKYYGPHEPDCTWWNIHRCTFQERNGAGRCCLHEDHACAHDIGGEYIKRQSNGAHRESSNSVATLRLLAKCGSMDLSMLLPIADELEGLLVEARK